MKYHWSRLLSQCYWFLQCIRCGVIDISINITSHNQRCKQYFHISFCTCAVLTTSWFLHMKLYFICIAINVCLQAIYTLICMLCLCYSFWYFTNWSSILFIHFFVTLSCVSSGITIWISAIMWSFYIDEIKTDDNSLFSASVHSVVGAPLHTESLHTE